MNGVAITEVQLGLWSRGPTTKKDKKKKKGTVVVVLDGEDILVDVALFISFRECFEIFFSSSNYSSSSLARPTMKGVG